MASVNPFERIRSTDGKIFWLLVSLVVVLAGFEVLRSFTRNTWGWLAVEAVVVSLHVGLGTYGTVKIVARPVRRAVKHFRRISTGDYSKPVLTRRTDEFGDMLRALDGMRISLAEAVHGRAVAERRYAEIVERSVQGFYQTSIDGDLLAANDALAQLLGYESPAAMLAEPKGLARRLNVDPARRAALIRQMREQGFVSGYESALRRRDGRIIWVEQSARFVRNDQGEPLYLEGFLEDITARKEAEQLKADFVSFVTHQLRTPLSGIRWMLELARESNPSPELASYLRDAHESAQRLIGLVNDLLDIARLESGRFILSPSEVDLQALTAAIVAELSPLAEEKQQRVDFTGGILPRVFVDAVLMRQAVMNLISNAIKYTPAGGSIAIETRLEGDQVTCAVRDTGIGVPKAAQKRLFEKFFRAENALTIDTEGTGLGLYLVRLIAERSGGSVSCESIEREGSTFTLKLPVAGEQQAIA